MDFVPAQSFVNKHLEAATGLFCVTSIPRDRPARFVRSVLTGGFERDPITDVPRLTFECWNNSKTQAERDAQMVRATIKGWKGRTISGVRVVDVDIVQRPSDHPDNESEQPRYDLTIEIALRGAYNRKVLTE